MEEASTFFVSNDGLRLHARTWTQMRCAGLLPVWLGAGLAAAVLVAAVCITRVPGGADGLADKTAAGRPAVSRDAPWVMPGTTFPNPRRSASGTLNALARLVAA